MLLEMFLCVCGIFYCCVFSQFAVVVRFVILGLVASMTIKFVS